MPMTPKQMDKLLLENGFVFQRQRVSHRMFFNPDTKRFANVPMHCKDLKPGTEHKILKDAGLK